MFVRRTVWYCHYGEQRAKPTDLWLYGKAEQLEVRPPCHNRRPHHDAGCCCRDHNAAPRGSITGTQGMETTRAAVVPFQLSYDVALAAEALVGPQLRVLDLFAGWGGWSAAFRERGHDVLTLDNDPRFGCDLTMDVRGLSARWSFGAVRSRSWRPDVILASPPCELFSTAGWHQHAWRMTGDKAEGTNRYEPLNDAARLARELVRWTVHLIAVHYDPPFAVVENPRALLRQLRLIPEVAS